MVNILIVEDDRETARALAEILASVGYGTSIVANGLEALRKVAAEVPDLILLDAEMPILDGPGMALALAIRRKAQPAIPIILVSALPQLPVIAASVGTPHYLKKPFSMQAVTDLVQRALASARR